MQFIKTFLAAAACAGALATPAHAILVADTGAFGAVAETFDSYDALVTTGPEALPSGISFTASIDSTLGAFAADLGDNGIWGGLSPFAGLGDLSPVPSGTDYIGSLTFSFAAATYGGGAFMNHYSFVGGTNEILVEALGASGNVLESHVVSFATGDTSQNAGGFYGIGRLTQDVYALRFSGDGVVLDDLRVATQPIPEPSTYALMAGGLGLLVFAARRRNHARV
jgi:hypothetical protein